MDVFYSNRKYLGVYCELAVSFWKIFDSYATKSDFTFCNNIRLHYHPPRPLNKVFLLLLFVCFLQRSSSTTRTWATCCASSTRWSKTSRRRWRSDTSGTTNTWRRWRGGAAPASATAASATRRVSCGISAHLLTSLLLWSLDHTQ